MGTARPTLNRRSWTSAGIGTGGLRRYDGAKGQATVVVAIGRGSTVRAHYEASATFENGPARFRIDLSNQDERWMIDGFFVAGAPVSRDL